MKTKTFVESNASNLLNGVWDLPCMLSELIDSAVVAWKQRDVASEESCNH